MAPAEFWMNLIRSACSGRARITAPPTLSEWPFRYFVVLCTTTSAPSFSGFCRHGVRKVLSTTEISPRSRAIRAVAAMSVRVMIGFVGVST